MFVDYPKIEYNNNPLDKIWDENVFEMIMDYLRRHPMMRLDVIRACFEIEYCEEMPKRASDYTPNYGVGGENGYEEVIVKPCEAFSNSGELP